MKNNFFHLRNFFFASSMYRCPAIAGNISICDKKSMVTQDELLKKVFKNSDYDILKCN